MHKTQEIVGIFPKLQRPIKRIGMSNNITLEALKERKHNKQQWVQSKRVSQANGTIFSSKAKLDKLVF